LTRAVVCDPDEVVVTSGAQQAFDLLARVLVIPGETVVAVEDPGYPPMRVAFLAAGAKLAPVPVDGEGMIVGEIPAESRVICLCPSHQFPLGVTMSSARRKALIGFAKKVGAVIVEDDYDGEFRHDSHPLSALRTPEAADVVFYVGTFSKCMLPTLRLGFIAAPEWALRALVAAKNCLDWHCSTPIQMGVAAFIAEGHLAHHVRKMRRIYQERRERLVRLLRGELAEWLDPIPSYYGMHLGAYARGPIDLDRVTEDLSRRHVAMHSFARYYLGRASRPGLIFGYGVATVEELSRSIELLSSCLTRAAHRGEADSWA
jgi:GntR family transcriptional regulator/MocR family aminotransferase